MTDVVGVPVRDEFATAMVDLVSRMVKALVDLPDEVMVAVSHDGVGTVLHLKVAPSDLGKVIGKQGRTARSMRTILGAASMKAQHRYALDIQQTGPADVDHGDD